MATVRFSYALKHSIISNANRIFSNKIKKLLENIPRNILYTALKKEYEYEYKLASEVPSNFLRSTTARVTLTITDTYVDENFEIKKKSVATANLILPDSVLLNNSTNSIEVNLYDLASPITKAIFKEADLLYKEMISVDKKIEVIVALLENNSSLNKALEQWGLLSQFVTSDIMNKINAPVKKRQKIIQDKKEINTDMLNSMTVDIMTKALKDE